MKWLAALIVLGLASTASARVVMMPTIPRTCGQSDSWEKLTTCLGRFGKPKVERELPGAKLVGIVNPKFNVPGLYLYRQSGKRWVIAGMFETSSTFEVFGLSRPTIAKRGGYRFDVGTNEEIPPPEGESAPRTIQQKISVFCAGDSYFCTQAVTSCDLIVDGRARESFRGKLAIKRDRVVVTGDRSRAGSTCAVPEEMDLGFADVPL
jgi:hypothetical protein